jgi:hypothetical protein
MGGSSSVTKADIDSLKKQISTMASDFDKLRTQVNDPSSKVAASINYQDLADKITSIDTYNQRLSEQIAKNPGTISDNLATKMASSKVTTEAITKGLETNSVFAESIANVLTDRSKSYISALQGPRGDTGSLANSKDVVKTSLYDTKYSLWCADGELCNLPKNVKGIDWGYGGSKIVDDGQLRVHSDDQIWFQVPGEEVTVQNGWGGLSIRNPNDGRDRQGEWTHFGHKHGNWRNYIRGVTRIDGGLNIGGGLGVESGQLWTPPGANLCNSNGSICVDVSDIKSVIDNAVRRDRSYFIRSNRGGLLVDAGGWSGNKGEWETMKFEQR